MSLEAEVRPDHLLTVDPVPFGLLTDTLDNDRPYLAGLTDELDVTGITASANPADPGSRRHITDLGRSRADALVTELSSNLDMMSHAYQTGDQPSKGEQKYFSSRLSEMYRKIKQDHADDKEYLKDIRSLFTSARGSYRTGRWQKAQQAQSAAVESLPEEVVVLEPQVEVPQAIEVVTVDDPASSGMGALFASTPVRDGPQEAEFVAPSTGDFGGLVVNLSGDGESLAVIDDSATSSEEPIDPDAVSDDMLVEDTESDDGGPIEEVVVYSAGQETSDSPPVVADLSAVVERPASRQSIRNKLRALGLLGLAGLTAGIMSLGLARAQRYIPSKDQVLSQLSNAGWSYLSTQYADDLAFWDWSDTRPTHTQPSVGVLPPTSVVQPVDAQATTVVAPATASLQPTAPQPRPTVERRFPIRPQATAQQPRPTQPILPTVEVKPTVVVVVPPPTPISFGKEGTITFVTRDNQQGSSFKNEGVYDISDITEHFGTDAHGRLIIKPENTNGVVGIRFQADLNGAMKTRTIWTAHSQWQLQNGALSVARDLMRSGQLAGTRVRIVNSDGSQSEGTVGGITNLKSGSPEDWPYLIAGFWDGDGDKAYLATCQEFPIISLNPIRIGQTTDWLAAEVLPTPAPAVGHARGKNTVAAQLTGGRSSILYDASRGRKSVDPFDFRTQANWRADHSRRG